MKTMVISPSGRGAAPEAIVRAPRIPQNRGPPWSGAGRKAMPIAIGRSLKSIKINGLQHFGGHKTAIPVIPSRPMSRWLCLLLLVCANAYAAPADEAERLVAAERNLLAQLQDVRHEVADRTTGLITTAMGFIGVPYRRGGNSVETGFDCSGLVRTIYEQAKGLALPRRANEQAAATEVIDKKDLQPGDLVFFNTMRRAFSHVGIYLGDGKFIHAPRSGAQVRVEDMQKSYWQRRFNGARRVAQDDEASASAIAASTQP